MQAQRANLITLVVVILLPTTSLAEGLDLEVSTSDRNTAPVAATPWMKSDLPASTRERLSEAFSEALRRLHGNAACRRLFEDLGSDGVETLAKTLYYRPKVREETSYCRRTSAFTWVGGRVTRVCRSFGRLPVSRAAVVLIHEALHQARMGEKPKDPQALDSAQINELVSKSCSL